MAVRSSSVTLWSGILAPAAAYAIDLQLRYALVPWACKTGRMPALTLISIPLLLISITGGLMSWRELHGSVDRMRAMALVGIALSFVFSLTIIAMTIPDFFVRPCE